MNGNQKTVLESLAELFLKEPKKKQSLAEIDAEGKKIIHQLQKDFGSWTRWIVTGWVVGLAFLFGFLVWYKTHTPKLRFFSDWVLVTLLGTSTATILGLPYIILRGLFPPIDPPKSSSDNST